MMLYFKNNEEKIFAYERSDIDHDNAIREQIDELERDGSHDELIAGLLDRLRISDELTQITESEKDELLKPSDEKLAVQQAKSEHAWVKSELERVDEQLKYHWTDDRDRKRHTEQAWKDCAIALRDYTSTDDSGNPVIVGESRPSIDDFIEVS